MTRVLLVHLIQETCSFAATTFDLDAFRRYYLAFGDEVIPIVKGGRLEPAGVLAAAAEEGIEVVPILSSNGGTGGPVTADAYAYLRERILEGIAHEAERYDGIVLNLHGAMMTEDRDDPDGDLMHDIRALAGPGVPIVCSLDMHAQFTDLMAASVDGIVGYHTHPHVDFYDTGYRALKLLSRALRGEVRPVVAHRKLNMIAPPESHNTTRGPMVPVMARVLAAEREPGILAAALFAVQPQLDLPGLGWSAVVTGDGDRAHAQAVADDLAGFAWDSRCTFLTKRVPIPEALRRARETEGGPFVLADSSDSVSGGGDGDSTWVLRGLLDEPVPGLSLVMITDPEAVAACVAAGVRAEVTLPVGGKINPRFSQPVTVTGRVRTLSDGKFQMKNPLQPADRGRAAVLQVGEVAIVLNEKSVYMWDEECYKSVGLDPREAKVVQLKSPGGFRPVYEPFARAIIELDCPGPTDSDLRRLPYQRVTRPLFPLDDI